MRRCFINANKAIIIIIIIIIKQFFCLSINSGCVVGKGTHFLSLLHQPKHLFHCFSNSNCILFWFCRGKLKKDSGSNGSIIFDWSCFLKSIFFTTRICLVFFLSCARVVSTFPIKYIVTFVCTFEAVCNNELTIYL